MACFVVFPTANDGDEARRGERVRHATEPSSRRRLQHVGWSLAYITFTAEGRSGQPARGPLSPALSPSDGARGKNCSGDRVTQGGARSPLALGYLQVIPTGFQVGSRRSQETNYIIRIETIRPK